MAPTSPMSAAEDRLRKRINGTCHLTSSLGTARETCAGSESKRPAELSGLVADSPAPVKQDHAAPPGSIPSPSIDNKEWHDAMPPPMEPPLDDGLTPLSVFVGTWNLAGEPWPEDLSTFLQPEQGFDVYSIGTEECGASIAKSILFSSKDEWVVALRNALPGYCLVGEETMVATHIVVFVKAEHMPQVRDVEVSSVATGIANTIGNKGGVGLSMVLGSTSMLFINAHFVHQFTLCCPSK